MVLPPMYTETFTKYRQDQLQDEAAHERLVRQARDGEQRKSLPRDPVYCCISGDVRSGFELETKDAA